MDGAVGKMKADRFEEDRAGTCSNGHVVAISDSANAADSSLIMSQEFANPTWEWRYGTGMEDNGLYNTSADPAYPSDVGGYKAATQGFTPKGAQVFTCPKGSNPMAGKG